MELSPSDKLRLFIAIDLPHPILERVATAARGLRERWPQARWTPIENQHVTLKFLGWVPAGSRNAVEAVCADVAAEHDPASVRLAGFGSFPSPRRVRVLWVGIQDPAGLLASLAATLDRRLETLGFVAEERGFTPHLTLARLKVPQRLDEPLPGLGPLDPFEVTGVALYRSHLSPRGPRYEALRRFELSGAP